MVNHSDLEKPSPPKRYIKFIGLICAASAGFFYALGNSFVQFIYRHNEEVPLSEFQIIFVRSAVQMIMIGVVLAWKKIDPFGGSKKNFGILMLMGLAKIGSIVFFYASMKILPLGDATVILFTAPVFTVFLGVAILKEKFSFCNIFFGLVSFLGVAIIAAPGVFFPNKPTEPNGFTASHSLVHKNITYTHFLNNVDESVKGVGFGVLAALSLSFHMIILKYSTISIDYRISLLYPSLYGIVMSPIAMGILTEPVILGQLGTQYWLLMASTGFLYFCAMMLLAISLTLEDAGPVALTRNSEVLFAFAFEILIEYQRPMVFTGVGVFLILLGTLMIMINRVFAVEKKLFRCCRESTEDNDLLSDEDDEVRKPIIEQYQLVPSDEEKIENDKEK